MAAWIFCAAKRAEIWLSSLPWVSDLPLPWSHGKWVLHHRKSLSPQCDPSYQDNHQLLIIYFLFLENSCSSTFTVLLLLDLIHSGNHWLAIRAWGFSPWTMDWPQHSCSFGKFNISLSPDRVWDSRLQATSLRVASNSLLSTVMQHLILMWFPNWNLKFYGVKKNVLRSRLNIFWLPITKKQDSLGLPLIKTSHNGLLKSFKNH